MKTQYDFGFTSVNFKMMWKIWLFYPINIIAMIILRTVDFPQRRTPVKTFAKGVSVYAINAYLLVFCAQNMKKALKIKHFCLIFNVPQSLFATRFERATYRLGEPLNLCHLCSPMYRKAAFHQAFFEFRICFGSPKFTFVVRSLCLHFSRLLDFAKKGKGSFAAAADIS